ncbi:WD40 repeat domain-containing protein [Actinophytocola oryzae]|uniref:WD40 repeat protein n=1 Tax=Actinophytocola oryzae TaxID=502181 RepID=A0A4V3FU39_9PSEU|nr:WD40 repeat domain-containing protein [Actinophytocola oryzae]TDV53781.1 WD40 repeat protein [Actinophytocola oryzae]
MPRPQRPVDPADGAVQEFAVALRELRARAGGPTYRSLAERTGLSVSTLADAAGGRRLPTFAVAVAYAVACGGDEHEWAARWRTVAEGEATPDRAPYRGMAGFRGQDADLFFGREHLVAELAGRVREHPVTVVLGASGAGKSSLLAAGLAPALKSVRPVIVTPADSLPAKAKVLVVDQFEELFTQHGDAERDRYLDALLARRDTHVVLAVRADYYGRCAEHPGLAEALRANQVLVGPMSEDELRDALTRPAAAVGLSVERALVATVLQEARGRAGVLPLLSHAMLETWRRRRGTVLTLACFEAAGGIDGAVVRTAEDAYAALDPAQRELAPELLLRMLSIDESVTRRRVDLADVRSVDPGAGVVIDRLADARLVTVDGGTVELAHDAMLTAWPRLRSWIDDHRDAVRAHRKISEAARIWVESERDPSALASGGRLALMKAHTSVLSGVLRLSQVEKDFLRHSDAQAWQAARAARRRTVRQRVLVASSVVAVVVAALFAAVADEARTDADAARDTALSQRIAATVQSLRLTDPALAAQLAVVGYRTASTSDTRSTLLETSSDPVPARYLGAASTALAASPHGGPIAVSDATNGSVTLFTQSRHGLTRAGAITSMPAGIDRSVSSAPKVYALALSPNDELLAVGDSTSTVTLWDVSDPRHPARLGSVGGAGPVERVAIDPTGAELAVAGADRVKRWAVEDPRVPRELPSVRSPARVRSLEYSPLGGQLAFGTDRGTAHVWSLAGTPVELAALATRDRPAPMVSYAPDGQLLVRPENEDTVRLWDVSSAPPRPGKPLSGLGGVRITTAAFSPDGRHLVASGADSTVYVLDTGTWTVVRTLPHPDIVTRAVFTSNGGAIVTTATDGALRWWSLRDAVPTRAPAQIGDLHYSADGTRLAVFAEGEVALWDRGLPQLTRLAGAFSGAGDLSGDGQLLAAGTADGDVLLYDLTDPVHPRLVDSLGVVGRKVDAVAFDEDGTRLAAGGEDAAVRVWDLASREVSVFRTPSDAVLDLSWQHHGGHLAVASADDHVYLLDRTTTREVARLDAGSVHSAVFSPDGTLLASGGADGLLRLWDVSDAGAPHLVGPPATGPAGRVQELSFHPRGRMLAASVIDGTVWMWHIHDPAHPTVAAVLAASGSPLDSAVFRPAGDMLVAGGADRVVHSWHTEEEAVVESVCAGVGDPITRREWQNHLSGVPYDPPCR